MIGGKQNEQGGTETQQLIPGVQLPKGGRSAPGGESGSAAPDGRVTSPRAVGRQRILVIEDDEEMGDWLLEEFRRASFVVALATTGREGLGLIRSGLVDVVVSDMELRDLTGLDLLREIQGLSPAPKIIVTTSSASHLLVLGAIKLGASAVLCKPFGIGQLFTILARSLGN